MEPEYEALIACILLGTAFFLSKEPTARHHKLRRLWAVSPVWAKVFFWIGLVVLAHAGVR